MHLTFQRGISAKSNPWIVMGIDPGMSPEGLFKWIEKEPEESCPYRRLYLDYTYGLGKIYTEERAQLQGFTFLLTGI